MTANVSNALQKTQKGEKVGYTVVQGTNALFFKSVQIHFNLHLQHLLLTKTLS